MDLTRLAPSPTGALHLGNARTFLVNWLLARQRGWKVLLRIEDLDGPRVKAGADRQAIDDLCWLGLDWDQGPIYQLPRMAVYHQAVQHLLACGAAYPCICTRREVELAGSAPHAEDGSAVYSGVCRGRFRTLSQASAVGRPAAVRFAAPDMVVAWSDEFRGPDHPLACNVARELGDFVIAKADSSAAYQLAVVIDDAEMGVTHIVRGDDLIDSTPRQILLYHALGLEANIPHYFHLPLVVGSDGRRLAKRHGDTRLSHYRDAGVSPGRILALLACWSGIEVAENEIPTLTAAGLVGRFRLGRVPRQQIVFSGIPGTSPFL